MACRPSVRAVYQINVHEDDWLDQETARENRKKTERVRNQITKVMEASRAINIKIRTLSW